MAMHDEALLCIWISFLGFALDKSAGSAALVHTLRRFPAPAPPHSYHQGRGLERWTLRCANSLRMRGGDGNDAEEVDKGWGTYDLDAKDPFLDDGEENDRPWPEEANAKDEDQQLARGMKERLILGENKWYDDMYAGVDKNKYGDYDMHFDKDKDSDSSEVESSEKDEIERILEDNPEGYLGQVDEEGKKRLYPYLKEKYKYYERNVTLEERPPQHQFRVGDLVTLSKDFKTFNVSKYLKPGRDDVSDLDSDLPLNDAQFGPLKPEDVGVIVEDDNALKPYLVRALDSKTLKDGCPPEFVDTWWYLPEVLQRYHPPQKIEFAPDATIEIPRDFPSVKLAMKNLSEGQSLFVRSGDYRYEENMTGEARSRSWGRLIFGLWAHGRIETMTMLHTTNLCFTGCVEVHAGPWKFRKSQFRSAGGIAIKLMSEGNVSCIACGVGGFAWPISLNSAADGIYCSGKSQCQLTRCTVDKTGRASGLGVYAQDRSAVVAMDTNFDQNDRAIGKEKKQPFDVASEFALLGYNDEACFVLYKCTGRLPGELGLTGDYPGDNIMGPLPEQPMTDLPGSHGKLLLPTIDDRQGTRARFST
ncbi:hypothetical protein GUITHDRAFT_105963 [Guillardia theta CCMP2712]|uniref:Uncharacterized protein n=1 Tax=Guillardia theta (strain CCMP2712) TaxID=905079 RepID=L1JJV0_GUITC|nr:hypothetical protein GUITHDRAFT_105963 [Guillardia theta CCMP2712]EKX48355.1 hypothetical protein GUITHDRAFT_105963 [Guillardia theta CCMP2712]|eukprot:XP_005835335.1 hypothetical protein GUITHDRAFT_105963 [Guillardia theta CCMP2712]